MLGQPQSVTVIPHITQNYISAYRQTGKIFFLIYRISMEIIYSVLYILYILFIDFPIVTIGMLFSKVFTV